MTLQPLSFLQYCRETQERTANLLDNADASLRALQDLCQSEAETTVDVPKTITAIRIDRISQTFNEAHAHALGFIQQRSEHLHFYRSHTFWTMDEDDYREYSDTVAYLYEKRYSLEQISTKFEFITDFFLATIASSSTLSVMHGNGQALQRQGQPFAILTTSLGLSESLNSPLAFQPEVIKGNFSTVVLQSIRPSEEDGIISLAAKTWNPRLDRDHTDRERVISFLFQITPHPNIISALQLCTTGLVTEQWGRAFHEYLNAESLGPLQTLSVFHGIANGIAFMHASRVIHGNIGLKTVVLRHHNSKLWPKLISFQCSSIDEAPPLKANPYTAAPEQLAFNSTRMASDLFAFGQLGFACLYGQPETTEEAAADTQLSVADIARVRRASRKAGNTYKQTVTGSAFAKLSRKGTFAYRDPTGFLANRIIKECLEPKPRERYTAEGVRDVLEERLRATYPGVDRSWQL